VGPAAVLGAPRRREAEANAYKREPRGGNRKKAFPSIPWLATTFIKAQFSCKLQLSSPTKLVYCLYLLEDKYIKADTLDQNLIHVIK
jgi:hypothetical protein